MGFKEQLTRRDFLKLSCKTLAWASIRPACHWLPELSELPPPQEGPLTEEEKEEAKILHQNLVNYWQEHPEIEPQIEAVKDKLGILGFDIGSLEAPQDDPTPTGLFFRFNYLDVWLQIESDDLDGIVETLPRENYLFFKNNVQFLTGEKKRMIAAEEKATAYWQPSSPDEETTLEITQEILDNLLGNRSGHVVHQVTYYREEAFEGTNKKLFGQATPQELKFYLADDFQEINQKLDKVLSLILDELTLNKEKIDNLLGSLDLARQKGVKTEKKKQLRLN